MEKKKTLNFIIPAVYFAKSEPTTLTTTVQENKPSKQTSSPDNKSETPKESIENRTKLPTPPKTTVKSPVMPIGNRQSSGLSLKSIQRKKDHQIRQMDVAVNQEDLPKDTFSQGQLIASWGSYVESLEAKGRYNLAAILKIDIPKLKEDSLIALEFPNSTNKIEVERQQTELLQFLRKSLNNFDIKLDITVNESMEKEFAYTSEEKFAKLKAKNPAIESLKKTFNLEL